MRSPVLIESRNSSGPLHIWDPPRDNGRYSIGVDFAEHKQKDVRSQRASAHLYSGDRHDFNAATVWDVDERLHVASMHGIKSAIEWVEAIVALGYYYNTALLVPELNNPGAAAVAQLIEVHRYPRLYRMRFRTTADDIENNQYGYRTTGPTRRHLVNLIEETVQLSHHWTRDKDLVDELRTIVLDPNGEPRGMGSDKDDRVFSLGLALEGAATFHQQNEEPEVKPLVGDARIWALAREQLQQNERNRTAVHVRRHRRLGRARRF